MLNTLRKALNKEPKDPPVVTTSTEAQTLGKSKRKARLVRPAKSQKKKNNNNKSNVIVVKIAKVHVKTDSLQSTKKINLSNVVGRDFNIPVGGLTNNVILYNVAVSMSSTQRSWKLEKTYNDFRQLHNRIKQRFPAITKIIKTFPKRVYVSQTPTSPAVQYRKKFFQAYLQALLQLKPRLGFVNDFLELHKYANLQTAQRELNINDFEILKLLGKGSFGKVFLVRVLGSTDLYAMKVLRKSEVKKRRQIEHTKTELRVMGSADHPFICTLRYAFTTDTRLFMVSDFCQGGELFFHLKAMRHFSTEMVRFYSAEIALALNYLHDHNIIYRDIKPENVLLDKHGHIRITDFGLSRDNVTDPQGATTFCGTPEYLSPEMLLGRQRGHGYGKSVDWWGLGVLMYEMFFGWPPFYDRNKKTMCRKILKARLVFNNRSHVIPDEAKDIISGLLEKDPEKRLGLRENGFEDLKMHPFFENIDWIRLYQRELDPPFMPEINDAIDNFDKEFTDQSARITEHEHKDTELEEMEEEEEDHDVFEDFNFTRTENPDAFWDIQ